MEYLLVGLVAAMVTAFVVFLVMKGQKPVAGPDVTQIVQQLQQQNLQVILEQLNQHRQSSEFSSSQLQGHISETSKAVYSLQTRLAEIQEGNKHILEMHKGITDLQNILQAPKLRGERGEIWLEELLGQMIPKNHFEMQYHFKSGDIVDAVIKLRDNSILCIDSKFSLENFKKMLGSEGPEGKAFEKLFVSDVKKRIDEIAKKYILPSEGTLEFAFMYIPAENVYYQAFVEDKGGNELAKYAFERHVIPVSPNSLYPYMEIVMFGLKGMQMEDSVREIVRGMSELNAELGRFDEEYRKVGVHLKNAAGSFETSDKRLSKVQNKLVSLSNKEFDAPQLHLPGEPE